MRDVELPATIDLPGGSIRFDRATAADLEPIVELITDDAVARSRGDNADDIEMYRRAFAAVDADSAQLLVVGRDSADAVVATMQLTLIPGLSRRGTTRLQIEAVRVADSQRGGGLGSAMIEWAVGVAADRGASLVQLTSDTARADAHRFYERVGFTASHVGFKREVTAADRPAR